VSVSPSGIPVLLAVLLLLSAVVQLLRLLLLVL
jgi:hypothetical protein